MNMKRKYITAVLLLAPFYLFAAGFDHFVFAPHNGMTGAIIAHTSRYADKMYLYETMVGPAIGLDIIFVQKKNGFTFMINNNIMPFFVIEHHTDPYKPKESMYYGEARSMGFGIIGYFEFLFGYTHGIGSNFELMAGIGPAGLWPLAPALNMRLSGAYYFSKKCGIFFAVGNSLGCLPYPARRDINIVNATVISIGPVFRIDR